MLARTQPAYLTMTKDKSLIEWSDNIVDYGYKGLEAGVDCDDVFYFLVGYECDQQVDLPIVTTPNDTHASISILIEDQIVYVLLMDASKDFENQFLLQQKANETSLLNGKQRRLMSQLLATKLELEQKNQELEDSYDLQRRFLSGVSHEFRSPLTSIIGYANALVEMSSSLANEGSRPSGMNDACADKLRIIVNNSNYLLSLVENLLDHGKLAEQEIVVMHQKVNIGEFFSSLHEMLYPIAEKKEIDLLLTLNTMGLIDLDETKVRQCVINLVNNAIKFTDQGSVNLSVDHIDDELIIGVRDTGIGMTDAELNKVFNSFWQSKNHQQAGAGLGMTITKRILDAMAGEISIESEVGKGTFVQISIPAYSQQMDYEELEEERQSAEDAMSSKTILLVEDDPDISGLVQFYVETWGYQSVVCGDGQTALDWLDDNSADVILMDLNMPILDGAQTLTACRERGLKVPIYIMSAQPLGTDPTLDDTLKRHADGHILKPVDFRELEILLSQLTFA